MTTQALYQLLQLPQDVIDRLNGCAQSDLNWLPPDTKALCLNRAAAGDGPRPYRQPWERILTACACCGCCSK